VRVTKGDVLGLLNPSKSITGLGDLVPTTSGSDVAGDASSRGSLAGLLTLCLLFFFVVGPLAFVFVSVLDFLFLFVFWCCCCPSKPPETTSAVNCPLGVSLSDDEVAIADCETCESLLGDLGGDLANLIMIPAIADGEEFRGTILVRFGGG
jgi:hypothetical protein